MEKQNRYVASLSNIDLNKVWDVTTKIIYQPIAEIFYGITTKSINWYICLIPGCLFNILVLTRLDVLLFKLIRLNAILPPTKAWCYLLYCLFGIFSGFIVWGLWQTALHYRISRRLTEVFQTSGLKNAIGKLPSFVFDKPIDECTRRMRLTRANLPESQFIAAKENLESALQVYIEEIKEDRERGTVDIIYANLAMPQIVKIDDINKIGINKFIIGETRARKISVDLNEIPHYLVGGQSGGGKSTFLRQVITTLFLNNKNYRFYLLDLKGSLEFQLFEGLKRVTVIPDTEMAIDYLSRIAGFLNDRMELFKKAGCKDIAAYLQKPESVRRELEANSQQKDLAGRIVVVIDEAAELFMAGDSTLASKAQEAKRLAIKIAAQGRALGIHLIVATQRPEVKAVDGQIKANLSGVLAFQMPNFASSMTILDNARAAHLPKIGGRAIWKTGMDMIEVQTPYLTAEEATELLNPYKTKKDEGKNEKEVDQT